MGARAELVTLDDYIDAGITLGLSARRTLQLARSLGIRIRTESFMAAWSARLDLWQQRQAS